MFNREPKKIGKVEGDQTGWRPSFNGRIVFSETSAPKTSAENYIGRSPTWYRWPVNLHRKDRRSSYAPSEACRWQQRGAFSYGTATTTAPPPEKCTQQGEKRKACWEQSDSCKKRCVAVNTKDGTRQPYSSLHVDPVVEVKELSVEKEATLTKANKQEEKATTPLPLAPVCATLDNKADINVVSQTVVEQDLSLKRVAYSNGTATTTAPPPEKGTQQERKRKACWETSDSCKKRRVDPVAGEEVPRKIHPKHHGSKSHVRFSNAAKIIIPKSIKDEQVCRFGFPNPGQTCYMNSSLQSLLALKEFVRDVSSQQEVWSLIPDAELISHFMDIVGCHRSKDARHKLQALQTFKTALSIQAPEFMDSGQKDAHEFLTTVLSQMRSLAPLLQEVAPIVGKTYRCPVENNLVFKMQNTRTCKSCGAQSVREEEYTNLSLDLIPGGSVQHMLQEYQKETELDFNCECGGTKSSQRSTFLTLPKVLMLHLKRFTFTQNLQMVKLHDPAIFARELTASSNQTEGLYNLVSVISHLGSTTNKGHYFSEGLHPDNELNAPGDRWLKYNDSSVTETTAAAICEERQKASYILFYQSPVN